MKRIVGLFVLALGLAACGGETSVADIAVGDCFDDPDSEIVSALSVVDCALEHDNEVYAEVFMPGTAFPGDDGVSDFAFDTCLDEFEPYVGQAYEESPLDYLYLGPTEESWDAGDRVVLCVLYSADLSKLTGSMKAG